MSNVLVEEQLQGEQASLLIWVAISLGQLASCWLKCLYSAQENLINIMHASRLLISLMPRQEFFEHS